MDPYKALEAIKAFASNERARKIWSPDEMMETIQSASSRALAERGAEPESEPKPNPEPEPEPEPESQTRLPRVLERRHVKPTFAKPSFTIESSSSASFCEITHDFLQPHQVCPQCLERNLNRKE